jgi:uncharacterized membrane protein
MVAEASFTWSGPLPPPESVRAYEALVPGSAQLILNCFKEEIDHRRQLEQKAIDAEIADNAAERKEAFRGQVFGFIIALLGLGLAAALGLLTGEPWVGGAIGGTTIVSLVTVFIVGRRTSEPKGEEAARK